MERDIIYCIPNDQYKVFGQAVHNLQKLSGVTVDMYNRSADVVYTGVAHILHVGQEVTRYACQQRDKYTIITIKRDQVNNIAYLSDELNLALIAINNHIVTNSVGQAFIVPNNTYQRINNYLELVNFFPKHSKEYRQLLLKHGDIVVDLCDKITPMLSLGEFWYNFRYAVFFDLPNDVNDILKNNYGIDMEFNVKRVEYESIDFYKVNNKG